MTFISLPNLTVSFLPTKSENKIDICGAIVDSMLCYAVYSHIYMTHISRMATYYIIYGYLAISTNKVISGIIHTYTIDNI